MTSRFVLTHLALCALLLAASGCTAIFDHFSGRKEACAILAIGQPTTAKVLHLNDTGTTINQDPVVDFDLEVYPRDGGDPYEAHSKALVSRLEVPQVQPGTILPVKYDPKDRSRVALDLWECGKK